MITDDDIDNDNGGDGENRSLPVRLYQRVAGSPLLTGLIFGVVILLAVLMVFAGASETPMTPPEPTVIAITAQEQPVAAEAATPDKPAILSEDSAPSATIPVVAEAAIVISDVGISRRISEAVIRQLPTAVTIAISPYATNPAASIAAYKSAGNDVWLQLATRSTKAGIDPGPLAISTALAANENQTYLQQQLSNAGSGYVGLYIPQDADITANGDGWKTMALDLIGKNLMILDATPAKVATELYMPQNDSRISAYLKADAVVPGDVGPVALKEGLANAIPIILREREAIVIINRPTALSVTQVAEWLKTLRNQGIALVPASKFTGLQP